MNGLTKRALDWRVGCAFGSKIEQISWYRWSGTLSPPTSNANRWAIALADILGDVISNETLIWT